MRITGGKARSIPIRCPASITSTRPATDKLRTSLFSSLGPLVEGTHCLDLFAGVGSYGLEALSRGAQSVTFVEKSRRLIPIIEANIQATQKSLNAAPPPATSVLCLDALTWQSPKTFGLIFADPPYALLEKEGQRILKQLERLLAHALRDAPRARTEPRGERGADVLENGRNGDVRAPRRQCSAQI